MAGTTVLDRNFVADAFRSAFAHHEIEIEPADAKPLMGYHKPLAIQMLLEQLDIEPNPGLIEDIHADFENEMIEFYSYDPAVKPMPGAEEIFLELKEKGIKIALNTGFSKKIAETIINRFQWKERGLIDEFIGSNEVEKGRPYSYMIGELMQRAAVSNPSAVAKIGDTTVDIQEGKNAGCGLVIAVTTGAGTRDELTAEGPTHIIDGLAEIREIIK